MFSYTVHMFCPNLWYHTLVSPCDGCDGFSKPFRSVSPTNVPESLTWPLQTVGFLSPPSFFHDQFSPTDTFRKDLRGFLIFCYHRKEEIFKIHRFLLFSPGYLVQKEGRFSKKSYERGWTKIINRRWKNFNPSFKSLSSPCNRSISVTSTFLLQRRGDIQGTKIRYFVWLSSVCLPFFRVRI